MWPLVWLFVLPAVLLVTLLAGGLALNHLPWNDPPGSTARLQTYLDTHVAETAEGSPFPELRPRHYPQVGPDELYAVVERVIGGMSEWTVAARDAKMRRIEAVVSTPIFRFQDDMTIHVIPDPKINGAVLFLRSQSRIGHGDLGANTRHILDLVAGIEGLLRQAGKLPGGADTAGR